MGLLTIFSILLTIYLSILFFYKERVLNQPVLTGRKTLIELKIR